VNPVVVQEPDFLAHTRDLLARGLVFSIAAEGSTPDDVLWLQARLAQLDSVIGLKINLAASPDQALVRFSQMPRTFGLEGQSLATDYGWLVQWTPTGDGGLVQNPNDRHTLVHELGHTLGLGHPRGNPWSRLYNTSSTVMSYRKGPRGWNDWFSQADLAALQQTWNPEVGADQRMRWYTSRGSASILLDQRLQSSSEGGVITGGERSDRGKWGDLLIGDIGPDQLSGGAGRDWLTGGDGADQLLGGPDGDVLIGGPGSDWIESGGGNDIVATCRDGATDTVVLPARSTRRATPLIEALDRIDRIELIGAAPKAELSFDTASLDGLNGVGVFVDRRLAVLVADPWLSIRQLQTMVSLA
jgi:hypothetical protein